jgi:hypothetical protein
MSCALSAKNKITVHEGLGATCMMIQVMCTVLT